MKTPIPFSFNLPGCTPPPTDAELDDRPLQFSWPTLRRLLFSPRELRRIDMMVEWAETPQAERVWPRS